MSDKPIRVGFVGAGANTRKHHLPKLKAQPGVELVAVANRSKESGERVAREFETGRGDREANMWAFTRAALELLDTCIQQAGGQS